MVKVVISINSIPESLGSIAVVKGTHSMLEDSRFEDSPPTSEYSWA